MTGESPGDEMNHSNNLDWHPPTYSLVQLMSHLAVGIVFLFSATSVHMHM